MNTESISPTNHYLQKIKQAQLLSAEQEVELAQTIEAGREAWDLLQQLGAPATANQVELEPPATDSVKSAAPTSSRSELEKKFLDGLAARQEFIVKNLRLVVSFASNYRPTSTLGMDDLIQEGNIGLQRAVDKFDWRRGFKFSTSATWWIRQAIQRLIETEGQGPAHVSTKAAAYVRDYRAAEQSLARAGQPISDDAIQQKCRLNLGQIKQAKAAIAIKNPLSLEWSSTSDRPNENTLGDTIMDPDSEVDLQRLLDQEQVESLLKNTPMSDRQRDIVGSTYGVAGYKLTTQEELAKRYGVSTTKIRTERIFAEQAIRNTQNGNLHSL